MKNIYKYTSINIHTIIRMQLYNINVHTITYMKNIYISYETHIIIYEKHI